MLASYYVQISMKIYTSTQRVTDKINNNKVFMGYLATWHFGTCVNFKRRSCCCAMTNGDSMQWMGVVEGEVVVYLV